jgi:hypothetical protein
VTEEKIDPEKTVLGYLYEFGNTRENDLLRVIEVECRYSKRGCKKVLERLENKKKIFRIVHTKLRPPAVYFSQSKHMPLELKKTIIQERMRAQAQIESAEINAQYQALGNAMRDNL